MTDLIRKLAKNIYNLNLFSAAKDLACIKLFKNTDEFTRIQLEYLMYLYFYDSIRDDIATKKVSEKVLNSEIYEDAYYIWKIEKNKKVKKETDKKHDLFFVIDNSRK